MLFSIGGVAIKLANFTGWLVASFRSGVAALVLVIALPLALPLGPHPIGDWDVILYLGVFQIGLAYIVVTAGLRRVAALEASLLLLVESALNPVWTWWLFLRERPTTWALAGGAVIIGATAFQALRSFPQPAEVPA